MKTWQLLEQIQVKPFNIHAGLCSNLWCTVNRYTKDSGQRLPWSLIYSRLQDGFRAWPEFSGDIGYPISDPKKRYAPHNAFHVYDAWGKSTYAAKRRELLAFLITYFKERDE